MAETEFKPVTALVDLWKGIHGSVEAVATDQNRFGQALIKAATLVVSALGAAGAYSEPFIERNIRQLANKQDRPSLLPPNDYRELLLREHITPKAYQEFLERAGYTETDIADYRRLREVIPSPTDLITLAVKEAFNPEAIKEFNLEAEFPPEFAEWAKKQGISEDWAKKYWIAHWVLPSTLQGFEMLHRNVITPEQLDLLLKTADVAPFWREKLTSIAFTPFTRVDVRRMRAAGVLKSKEEVVTAYRDIGYDEEKAGKLAEWTEAEYVTTERELTKTEILKGVKIGQLTEPQAVDLLTDMGYDEDEADFIVSISKATATSENRELSQSAIIKQYKLNVINRETARQSITNLGYTVTATENLLSTADLERKYAFNLLSFGYVRELFRNNLMTTQETEDYMRMLGYREIDISRIMLNETRKKAK